MDTEKGEGLGSNTTFWRAWKRTRDEASNDIAVVLPLAATTIEVPNDDEEL